MACYRRLLMDPRVKTPPAGRRPDAEGAPPLHRIHSQLTQLLDTVEEVDALPTPAVQKFVDETIAALDGLLARREEKR
jgi:hypothetical protein